MQSALLFQDDLLETKVVPASDRFLPAVNEVLADGRTKAPKTGACGATCDIRNSPNRILKVSLTLISRTVESCCRLAWRQVTACRRCLKAIPRTMDSLRKMLEKIMLVIFRSFVDLLPKTQTVFSQTTPYKHVLAIYNLVLSY